jgi:hypothetical protein
MMNLMPQRFGLDIHAFLDVGHAIDDENAPFHNGYRGRGDTLMSDIFVITCSP